MVSEGKFRDDLFFRLNVVTVELPPLRARKEDIPLLVRYFVRKHSAKLGKKLESITENTMQALLSYFWPGNIRELENVIERSVITSRGSQFDLGNWLQRHEPAPPQKSVPTLAELEREHILRTLKSSGWKVSGNRGAASLLGLKPTTLEARMKKLGIKREN
jgi:transcriptional regulator with GAF, ATPase, and Fis domain